LKRRKFKKGIGADEMTEERKNILMLMVLTILSRALGFIREVALAAYFGTTMYTDAYLIATTIPVVIFSSFGEALMVPLIPLYIRILKKEGKEEASHFINSIFNIVGVFTLFLILLALFCAEELVAIFAVGFEEEAFELAVKFTKILLPAMFFIGMNSIFTGYMQANKMFRIPGMISIPYNGIVIVSIFLASLWEQDILIYGTLVGIGSQMVFQLYFAYRRGYSYQFCFGISDKNVKKAFFLSIPIFFGLAARELNVLIDKTLASTLPIGSISALNFASKLSDFVLGAFAISIVVVVYPLLSELGAQSNKQMFAETLCKSMNGLILVLIPISMVMLCLDQPIVKFLFQRGAFDEKATLMTSSALFFYSLGLTGLGIRELLSKAFYALADAKTPMVNGVMIVALNIFLDFLLLSSMAHKGIALATSVASWTGAGLLFYSLRKKISYPFGKQHCKMMLKGFLAALAMGVEMKGLFALIKAFLGNGILSQGIELAVVSGTGFGVYFIMIYCLKVEETYLFFDTAKAKWMHVCKFAREKKA